MAKLKDILEVFRSKKRVMDHLVENEELDEIVRATKERFPEVISKLKRPQ